MSLAFGYITKTLQTHDELEATRVNEQRRLAAERRAEEGERADGRVSLPHRIGALMHKRDIGGARAAH